MGSSSDLTAASWQSFSRLLDEALELPAGERLTWLEGLGGEHAALKPVLRAVLQKSAGVETQQWLATLPRSDAALAPLDESDLQPGVLVGPYRLLRELGTGGMGAVWLAERADGTLKRQVALKLPRATWARGLAERMARERDILASLEHPHIARLYDAGTDAHGRPFLALEYVEGQPIDVYCRERSLNLNARLQLLLQVAQAVAFAHSRLVIHRDLKPSNILVTADGQVRLLDFGIAKLMEGDRTAETQLTQMAGRALTLDYASPEQIRGEPIGTPSDVYSLGVVAFELLAGAKPYKLRRGTAAELEEAIASADAPLASAVAIDAAARKELKGDLDAILNEALKKTTADRYPTAWAFGDDLQRWLDGDAVSAQPDRLGYRARKFVGRNRIAVGAAGAVLIALLAGTSVALWQGRVAKEQAHIARQEAARAKAVQTFLLDLFESNAGPRDRAVAQQTTARELLDRGAERVDDVLKDDPEVRFDVLRSLADVYWRLDLQEKAAEVERKRVELARRIYGAADARLARVLLDYAETIQESPRRDETPALLVEAQRALAAAGQQNSEMQGQAFAVAADYWRHVSLPKALESAEEGVRFLEQNFPDSDRKLVAHMHAARMRTLLGDFDAALVHAGKALELSQGKGELAGIWSLRPSAHLADVHYARHALADAETWMRKELELAIRVQGERHLTALAAKARLGNLLQELGRHADAEALLASAQQVLVEERDRIDPYMVTHVRGLLGQRLLERGRPDQLQALLAVEVAELKREIPHSNLRAARQRQWAQALAALGRHDEARVELAESQETWRQFAGDRPSPYMASSYAIAWTDVELAAGNPRAALAALARDPPTGTRAQLLYPLRRAKAWLALDDIAQAQAALQDAARLVSALADAERPVALTADLLLLEARVRLAQRDPVAAEALLRQALQIRLAHDAEGSLWVADVSGTLADSLARQGRRAEARALQREADTLRAAVLASAPSSRAR